jgi:hypothetical protein
VDLGGLVERAAQEENRAAAGRPLLVDSDH